jgi:transposase
MVCNDCKIILERLEMAEKRIIELEKKLLAYENAHTPSSKVRFPPRVINENKKLPGQKIGHVGKTRKKPIPDMSIELIEEQCPDCQGKLGIPFKTISKVIEEIPEPQPIQVTEYKINHYFCMICKKEAPIPKDSNFGANVLSHISLLKFEDRLPLRKVCATANRQYNLPISPGTVFNITERVSNAIYPVYKKIITRIRCSKSVNIDESEMRVGGLNYHIWTFSTKNEQINVIRKSRGKVVIEEVLGKKYKGVIGCDGWASYESYSTNLQRCWAHLLREAKYLAEQHDSAKFLYEGLKRIYKKATSDKPPSKNNLIIELEQWIDYANSYQELRKFSGKIHNGIGYWFTFLGKPYVEPTNNKAERALRELIVQRKIIGTLRNDKGAAIMERITSCIATWKLQGLNPFSQLKVILC